MPKVTYASFNGLSTNIVRRPDGTGQATVFASRDDPRWPTKRVRSAARAARRAAAASPASPASSGTARVPSPGGASRHMTRNPGEPVTVSVAPFDVSSPGRDARLRWTGAQVAGIDWQGFVILPAEPPRPPPSTLKERIQKVLLIDADADIHDQLQQGREQKDALVDLIDDFDADQGDMAVDHTKFSATSRTLAERIHTCPKHRTAKYADSLEVRTMLTQHLRLNKEANADINGRDATPTAAKENRAGGGDDDSDESGVSVMAGQATWEISDPRFLAQERDRLTRENRELLCSLDEARGSSDKQQQKLRQEVRRLRRALDLPADSDEEGYAVANSQLAQRMQEAAAVRSEEQQNEPSESSSSGLASESSGRFFDIGRRKSGASLSSSLKKWRRRTKGGHEARAKSMMATDRGEGDIYWAERQLGFMGVHRGNVELRRKDIEDHMQMLWRSGRRRDAYDANKAMEILHHHAHKEDQDVGWAEQMLAPYGLSWMSIDRQQKALQDLCEDLERDEQPGKAADLRHAAEIATRHLQRRMEDAVHVLEEFGADETNFLSRREDIRARAEQYHQDGQLGREKSVLAAYADLRRRRRAIHVVAGAVVLGQLGLDSDTPWAERERRCQDECAGLLARGDEELAVELQEHFRVLEQHHDDASAWAQRVLRRHKIPLAGKDQRDAVVAAARELKDTNTRHSLHQRKELILAREVLVKQRAEEEHLLDSDLDEAPEPMKGATLGNATIDLEEAGELARYRRKTLDRELQRMLDSGEVVAGTAADGRTQYVDTRTGRPLYDLDGTLAGSLAQRRIAEDADVPDTDSDASDLTVARIGTGISDVGWEKKRKPKGAAEEGRSKAPGVFAQVMMKELEKIDSSETVGMTGDDKVRLARERARNMLRLSRLPSHKTDDGRSPLLDVSSRTPEVVTPPGVRAQRKQIYAETLRSLKEDKVRQEVQRMESDGRWQRRSDKGRQRFVHSATGEVAYDLHTVAEQELRQRGELPDIRPVDSDDSAVSSIDAAEAAEEDALRAIQALGRGPAGSSRVNRALTRKLSRKVERMRSADRMRRSFRRGGNQERLIAEEVQRLTQRGYQQGVDAQTGEAYFVHRPTGQVQRGALEDEARRLLVERGALQAADDAETAECPRCRGAGSIAAQPKPRQCPLCRGAGRVAAAPPAPEGAEEESSDDSAAGARRLRTDAAGGALVMESKRAAELRALRQRLLEVLRRNDPGRLDEADDLLRQWHGQEERQLAALEALYRAHGPSPPPSPVASEGSPQRRARTESRRAEQQRQVIAAARAGCRSPRRLRRLLIRLYAAAAPQRLGGVGAEVSAHSHSPDGLIARLIEEFGVDQAASAWAETPPEPGAASAPTLFRTKDLMLDAVADLAGVDPQQGPTVTVSQLSPVFREPSGPPSPVARTASPAAPRGPAPAAPAEPPASPRRAAERAAALWRQPPPPAAAPLLPPSPSLASSQRDLTSAQAPSEAHERAAQPALRGAQPVEPPAELGPQSILRRRSPAPAEAPRPRARFWDDSPQRTPPRRPPPRPAPRPPVPPPPAYAFEEFSPPRAEHRDASPVPEVPQYRTGAPSQWPPPGRLPLQAPEDSFGGSFASPSPQRSSPLPAVARISPSEVVPTVRTSPTSPRRARGSPPRSRSWADQAAGAMAPPQRVAELHSSPRPSPRPRVRRGWVDEEPQPPRSGTRPIGGGAPAFVPPPPPPPPSEPAAAAPRPGAAAAGVRPRAFSIVTAELGARRQ